MGHAPHRVCLPVDGKDVAGIAHGQHMAVGARYDTREVARVEHWRVDAAQLILGVYIQTVAAHGDPHAVAVDKHHIGDVGQPVAQVVVEAEAAESLALRVVHAVTVARLNDQTPVGHLLHALHVIVLDAGGVAAHGVIHLHVVAVVACEARGGGKPHIAARVAQYIVDVIARQAVARLQRAEFHIGRAGCGRGHREYDQ